MFPQEPMLPRHKEPVELDMDIPVLAPIAAMPPPGLPPPGIKWVLPLAVLPIIVPNIPHHDHSNTDDNVYVDPHSGPVVAEAPTWTYLAGGLGLFLAAAWVRRRSLRTPRISAHAGRG
jgi:hypothetical protein